MWKQHLRPFDGETMGDTEPFDEWYGRIASNIPGVPAELARHWLYENWGALPHNVSGLSLSHLSARQARITLAEALEVTVHVGWTAIKTAKSYLDGFRTQENWLAVQMAERGTWPLPIVVLDNEAGLVFPGRTDVGRRHLLEGHRRLTFLHGLAAHGTAQQTHDVWLVRSDKPALGGGARSGSARKPDARLHDVRLKFEHAVESLAIGTGSIQDRLIGIFRGHGLDRVLAEELREHHEVWSEMREALRRVKDKDRGSIVASIMAMSDREACHRARTIVELSRWLFAHDRFGQADA